MFPGKTSNMTEKDFQTAVIDLCRILRLRVAHFRPARTGKGWVTPVQADGAGFPDLVVVGPNGVAFRELKSQSGRQTDLQRDWMTDLSKAGADADLWRPNALKDGTIVQALERLAGRHHETR